MITAHSGSDGYPDNSLAFIQAMFVAQAVEALEIDCQYKNDGTLYLSHDPVDDSATLPTLAELFQLAVESDNQHIMLNIDCKQAESVEPALKMAEKFGLLDRVVISGSIVLDNLDPVCYDQLFYNLENQKSLQEIDRRGISREFLVELHEKGIRTVQLPYQLVNPKLIRLLDEVGLKISTWTVNDIETIDLLLSFGCYNVTTRIALEYLRAKGALDA